MRRKCAPVFCKAATLSRKVQGILFLLYRMQTNRRLRMAQCGVGAKKGAP